MSKQLNVIALPGCAPVWHSAKAMASFDANQERGIYTQLHPGS
jgi:hypothetical protein